MLQRKINLTILPLSKKGTQLQHAENAPAKTTLVFLHGWCCAPEDFNQQINFFSNEYDILVPDYSNLTTEENSKQTFQSCVNTIASAIQEQSNKPIILIGHSMGGIIALCLAESLKEQLTASIIIDSTMPQPISRQEENFLIELNSNAGERAFKKTVNATMVNNAYDDLKIMKKKTSLMLSTWKKQPKIATNLLKNALLLEKTTLLSRLTSPLLYIACNPARGDIDAIKKLKPDVKIESIKSGHFAMINQPEKLNISIKTFLENLN